MSHNTIGHLFRVTTWGESHGPAIGCVIDGCPPGIALAGRGHPGVPGQAPARPIALHHPAPRARRRAHPVRRVRRRGRPPGDHRHADLARHRQRRPARARLRRHQGQVPARPCRFHLPGEIRHPRLPRRRALLRARDGHARGRRRGCPQAAPRRHHPRRAGSDRQARDRPRALELGRDRQQPLLLARRRHRRNLVRISRRGAQGRLLGRRGDRGGGRGRARRLGCADLRQARSGPGRRHDVASTPSRASRSAPAWARRS